MDPQDLMQQLFKAFSEKAAAVQASGLEASPEAAQASLAQAQSAMQAMQADLDAMKSEAESTLAALRKPAETPERPARPKKPKPAPATMAELEHFVPGQFVMIRYERAIEVCRQYHPSREAMACLGTEMTPRHFFDALVNKELYQDAVEFLAYGLSARPRVVWTAMCLVSHHKVSRMTSDQFAALRIVMQWVLDGSDENRCLAGLVYDKIGATTPVGNLALAVFASGGSLAPPDLPAVPPPPVMMPRAILAAHRLLHIGEDTDKRRHLLRDCLLLGCQFGLLRKYLELEAGVVPRRHAIYDHLRARLRRLLIDLDLLPDTAPVEHEENWEREVWEDLDG